MLTQLSLQTLVDISRHPTLSKCIKRLIIGLDHLRAAKPETLPTLQEYERFRIALSSQDRLLDTGAAVELLAEALSNLPAVETVDIRDFNSASRFRDTNDRRARAASARVPEWKSYGHSEHGNWLGHLGSGLIDPYSPLSAHFVDRVFKLVLTALGRTTPGVQSLEVILRNSRVALRDDAFAVFPALDPGIPVFLRGLTRLHLDVCPEMPRVVPTIWQTPNVTGSDPPSPTTSFDPSTATLRRFLSFTPNVTWLRLNFSNQSFFLGAALFLHWLSFRPGAAPADGDNRPWSDFNPAPVALPLKKLDLGNLNVHSDVLAALVRKFSELEELSLKRIGLLFDASKYADDETSHGSPWPRFFLKLPTRAPKIKSLSLRNLRSGRYGLMDDVVFDDGTTNADAHFANRPRRFVYELRDLDKDQAGIERLAAMTWAMRCFNKTRRRSSASESHEDDESDGSQDELHESVEEDSFGEDEVDEFYDHVDEDVDEEDVNGFGQVVEPDG